MSALIFRRVQLKKLIIIALWLLLSPVLLQAQPSDPVPVTPNASDEAAALLRYLYEISGQQILTGQHCAPLVGSARLPGIKGKNMRIFQYDKVEKGPAEKVSGALDTNERSEGV